MYSRSTSLKEPNQQSTGRFPQRYSSEYFLKGLPELSQLAAAPHDSGGNRRLTSNLPRERYARAKKDLYYVVLQTTWSACKREGTYHPVTVKPSLGVNKNKSYIIYIIRRGV